MTPERCSPLTSCALNRLSAASRDLWTWPGEKDGPSPILEEGSLCTYMRVAVLPVTCHLSFTGIQVLRLRYLPVLFHLPVSSAGCLFCNVFSEYPVNFGALDAQPVFL